MILPPETLPLLQALTPLFTKPTGQRFLTLLTAAILARGRRTIANPLHTLGPLANAEEWAASALSTRVSTHAQSPHPAGITRRRWTSLSWLRIFFGSLGNGNAEARVLHVYQGFWARCFFSQHVASSGAYNGSRWTTAGYRCPK
jgi:hypothetical protein